LDTQGSGKSILMVLIAKWLLEYDPHARILIVTDRDELDKQIEGVMRNAGILGPDSPSPRMRNMDQLRDTIGSSGPRLICTLIHKFDPPKPEVRGSFYVFVDECHRTQGGDMNHEMKRWLEGAIFIGFTGTPLLRKDRETTMEVFGTFIHTYKFHEAVRDKVILDLKYEARTVPQRLTDKAKIDAWFDSKTQNLNRYQQAVLRKRWATLEDLMSSSERKQRIVNDIIQDFSLLPRLSSHRGAALLVAASIYDACHYYRLFKNTYFAPHVGIVTSFQPNYNAISREPAGSDERYKFDTYTQQVLPNRETTKDYEDRVKYQFINEPATMKLLVVVSKLLTGFDAPSCTYIYLDNEMHDHNLFQAICRTNRLDGDDKDYGYIVDYKELLKEVETAIAVYTSDELDISTCGTDANAQLKDWKKEGKKQLDEARQALHYHCVSVAAPKEIEQYLEFFCGDASNPTALTDTEPLRITFYQTVATFLRAYSALAVHLNTVGYSAAEIATLQKEAKFYAEIRQSIKIRSGEELNTKPYEADMRHLINTYIQADPGQQLGPTLDQIPLTELIVETGIHDAIARKINQSGKLSNKPVAEAIINNVRKTIVRSRLTDPRFYQEMSKLLEDLIKQKSEDTKSYEQFLIRAEQLAQQLVKKTGGNHPAVLNGKNEAIILFNNLSTVEADTFVCPTDDGAKAKLALDIDNAVKLNAPASWKGDPPRETVVLNAIHPLLGRDRKATTAIFDIIKNQAGY